MFTLGWLVLGAAMGAGLYDPAFATLGRLYGTGARAIITSLTLIGGFASTVCWPLSALLLGYFGWRGTCLAYAVVNLGLVLPLYRFGLPAEAPAGHAGAASPRRPAGLFRTVAHVRQGSTGRGSVWQGSMGQARRSARPPRPDATPAITCCSFWWRSP